MIEGKIENSGIGVFPHSFGFFRFTSQISFLVGILLLRKVRKDKRESMLLLKEGKKKSAYVYEKRIKRFRDGGWGRKPFGRARLCCHIFALFLAFVGFCLYFCGVIYVLM